MHSHDPLLSALLHQRVGTHLQPSAVNPPPLPQILVFPLQQEVPPLQPLSECDIPPTLSILFQGRGEHPLLPSTVHAYVPLLSVLLLRQGVNLRQPSAEPAPLPQLPALPLQRVLPPLQPLAVRDPPPPPF